MLSLPQKAVVGLASALVVGALVPSAANASLFRFGVSGEFQSSFNPGESFTDDLVQALVGGSFEGEVTTEGLPASGSNIELTSWSINLLDIEGSLLQTLSSESDFPFGRLFAADENLSADVLNFSQNGLGTLQLSFEPGFIGFGSVITDNPPILSTYIVGEFDFSHPDEPEFIFRGSVNIASGFAELIPGPIFSEIEFTFDDTVATLESPPTLVEQEAGLSVEGLSYSLKALDLDLPLQEFSWNATSDISVSWTEPSFARIFGSTTLSLEDSLEEASNQVEFFVKGFLGDESNPFEVFTKNLSLKPGMSQLVAWDLTKIASLLPGDYTLGLTSGVRWQPGSQDSVLTVSSQYGADVAPVPTPALLPGLLGMGVAAFRKHKRQDESLRDSV